LKTSGNFQCRLMLNFSKKLPTRITFLPEYILKLKIKAIFLKEKILMDRENGIHYTLVAQSILHSNLKLKLIMFMFTVLVLIF